MVQKLLEEADEENTWAWELIKMVNRTEWEATMDNQQQQENEDKKGLHFGYQYAKKVNNNNIKDNTSTITVLQVISMDNKYMKATTGFRTKMNMLAFFYINQKGL